MTHLLRAEWTKLRSVRRWVIGLLATVALTALISLLGAAGSSTDVNDHPELLPPVGPAGDRVHDALHLVYQPMTGDGSITARLASQEDSHEWAKAGVIIRESTQPGSRYAAVLGTPGHGIRFHADYTTDQPGSDSAAPRWLRLVRTGTTIIGYESAGGTAWNEVGRVELSGLPETVQVGMFVTSPDQLEIDRGVGSTSAGGRPTRGTATFDNVRLEPDRPQPPVSWQDYDTSTGFAEPGGSTEADGAFTVTGSGDIGPYPPDDDLTQLSLLGISLGQIAVVVVAVLFVTSEFKRGMIRTTFTASPRRGRVLVAKAIVIGAVTSVVGLVASLAGFFLAQPMLRAKGYGPPAYPEPSLTDWPVLRAVVGAAVLLALVAVLSLGVGAILRHSAGAIAGVIVMLVPSIFIAGALPLTAAQWLMRSTPAGALSIMQTVPRDPDTAIDPWGMTTPGAGLAVLCGYAAVALAVALWLVRRRDA